MEKKKYFFSQIKDEIRPFDIVFFKGGDFVSDFIRWSQKKSAKIKNLEKGDFSHVGIIVTTKIFDHPNMIPGKYYVLESTISGYLGNNIKNIDGNSLLGVQIRDFEALIPAYINSKTSISVGRLSNHPFNNISEKRCKRIFTEFYNKHCGKYYEMDPIALSSSLCGCLRSFKKYRLSDQDDYYFCSELVAKLFQDLDILDIQIDPETVVPMDFLGNDIDEYIPKNFVEKIYHIKQIKN